MKEAANINRGYKIKKHRGDLAKGRNISMTDEEWNDLVAMARQHKLSCSDMIRKLVGAGRFKNAL